MPIFFVTWFFSSCHLVGGLSLETRVLREFRAWVRLVLTGSIDNRGGKSVGNLVLPPALVFPGLCGLRIEVLVEVGRNSSGVRRLS